MRVLIVGGGPGGLYLAIVLKRLAPQIEVTVLERHPAGARAGFGILLSEEPAGPPEIADRETFAALRSAMVRLDAREIRYQDRLVRATDGPFFAVSRDHLLGVLQRRCRELGVRLRFGTELGAITDLAGAGAEFDLIVGADGTHSRVRTGFQEQFGATVTETGRVYCWLGTRRRFDRVRLRFQESRAGLFWAYAYRYGAEDSTFVVECDGVTWQRAGLDHAGERDTVAFLEQTFREDLEGAALDAGGSRWMRVLTVRNERWHCRANGGPHVVLLGDAAHTAHFTASLATRAAMVDAAALAGALRDHCDLETALAAYQAERQPVADEAWRAADDTSAWLAEVNRYLHFMALVCGGASSGRPPVG